MIKGVSMSIKKLIKAYQSGKITPEKRFEDIVKNSQKKWLSTANGQ